MHKIKYDQYDPKANKESVIESDKYRFTILTSKLVRIEYSEVGVFEDSQTKLVLNRNFTTPLYKIYETKDSLKIVTKDLTIKYNKKEFTAYGLSVELNGEAHHPYREIWHYGDKKENLGGTIRTLDFIDGSTELEDGLMSKHGISMIDDSHSPILLETGWYKERESNDIDLYIFGYKRDYLSALNDFYQLTGSQPKLPRYALGNWWSRYYAYSEDSYVELMDRFEEEETPFSVAVIDMDWHLVDIPEKYGSKWTGYTWNNDLFPNPERFIDRMKNKDLAITLNVHPAAGVRPFEEMYQEMAEDLGVNWENGDYIDFDSHSEEFFNATFKHLYYPNEKIGVDFWWIDWQQSPYELDESQDPLWVLNHYHYGDNQKDNNLGLTFSRYSGPGSHRYPIGFSGDVVISWESLDFQPYFTTTASNIGYGWWSHDIGGHRHGIRDDELMLRWLQFGVFSPINRLHSSDSEFVEKEPWNFSLPYSDLMRKYLRLRHEFLPYTYTMNILANEENLPLIQPMYYKYPHEESSYEVPNQYYFGTDLIVCPMTEKIDDESLNASFKAWLPKGSWYDLQSGLKYMGDRMLNIHRPIDKMALFLKEGSIIPLANLEEYTNSVANPEKLNLKIGYGASGEFTLKEDQIGKENIEAGIETHILFNNEENSIQIQPAEGNLHAIPSTRSWKVNIYGVRTQFVEVKIDNEMHTIETEYNTDLNVTTFEVTSVSVKTKIDIKLKETEFIEDKSFKLQKIKQFLKDAQTYNLDKAALYDICKSDRDLSQIIAEISSFSANKSILNSIMEILLA